MYRKIMSIDDKDDDVDSWVDGDDYVDTDLENKGDDIYADENIDHYDDDYNVDSDLENICYNVYCIWCGWCKW